MQNAVTREHKLALIVGFSLVLLVGVLISDHLSRARQARIAPVGPGEIQNAELRVTDPLKIDGPALREPAPVTVVQQNRPAEPPASVPTPSIAAPAPTTLASNTPPQPVSAPTLGGSEMPLEVASGRAAHSAGLDPLEAEIIRNNGRIVTGPRGEKVFSFDGPTPAAATSRTAVLPELRPAGSVPAVSAKASPLPADVKLYTVQKGDTLLKIAERTYGSARLWHDLAKYNGVGESGLRLGAQIRLPSRAALTGKPETRPVTALASAKPAPAQVSPVRMAGSPKPKIQYATYTVKTGDTLGHISQRVLGSSRRVQEILDLNRLSDEDSIAAGTILKMPLKG